MSRQIRTWLQLLFFFVLFFSQAYAASLSSMKVVNGTKFKSIFLKLSVDTRYQAFILHFPERLVIDLQNTNLGFDLNKIPVKNDVIDNLRIGHPTKDSLRLVFDLRKKIEFTIKKHTTIQSKVTVLQMEITSTNQNVEIKHPVPVISQPKSNLRDVIVIIDPGHGGKDPGAIGMNRSQEKHIVLAIAKRLKKIIDSQPGMRGELTSEAARWLAEKENYSELGGVNLSRLDDKNGVIRTVLIDLSQTAAINASLSMGKSVLNNLDKITSLHSKKVEQARFMVLKSPDIPSVLIETGFISNPREEKNLTSPYYQARLTKAIFAGIKTYFWSYPPYGSLIEAKVLGNKKIAKRDDVKKVYWEFH